MTEGPEFRFLRKLPLFATIDDPALLDMSRCLIKKKIKAGQHVFYQDDMVEHLHILEMGTVEIYKSDSNGKVVTLWHIEAERAFCLANLFAGRSFANAQALTDCLLFYLQKRNLIELLGRYPDLSLHFLTCVSSKLAAYSTLLEDFTFKSVQERLAKIILAESVKDKQSGQVCHLSQNELACRLGTCREVVSRTLTKLKNEGLLETEQAGKGSKIVVKNRGGLKQLVEGA